MIRLQSPRSKSAVGPEGNQQSECLKLAPFLKMLWGFIAMASPCGATSKESTCNVRDLGLIPALGRSLEKGKATHSSILAWRISWIYGVAWESLTLANGFISFVNHEYEIIYPLPTTSCYVYFPTCSLAFQIFWPIKWIACVRMC